MASFVLLIELYRLGFDIFIRHIGGDGDLVENIIIHFGFIHQS